MNVFANRIRDVSSVSCLVKATYVL